MERYREEARLAKCQVDILENALDKMKEEIGSLREDNLTLKDEAEVYEGLKERSVVAITSLQNSNRDSQRKVAQLEAKVRQDMYHFMTI